MPELLKEALHFEECLLTHIQTSTNDIQLSVMAIYSVIKLLKKVNLWKTLYFNLHYFPFLTAIRMPVLIYWRSELYKRKGRIVIDAPYVYTGMLKFGPHGLGTQDVLYSRTMWEVSGTLVIKGKANIGCGSKVSVGKDATLTLGENFIITGNTEIICQKEISFGKRCLLSWDILIMDTDFRHILNTDDTIINVPKKISIGNNVWIGCRNTILKGVSIADNNVVGAKSTINRDV
ncbi:MAG: acyltransferase, partial [Prevotella sp.]|nr:acyltransferase [Prevotella sp.]